LVHFSSNNPLLALAMPTAHTAGKLNKIKDFGESDFCAASRLEIYGTLVVPAVKFFGATGTTKKPQTISAWGLEKFFQISRTRDRRSTKHFSLCDGRGL
jgi:hypothetical protein